jgi:Fic family protein
MKWVEDIRIDIEIIEMLYRLENKKSNINKHRPIHPSVLSNISEALNIEWIYNSNSIEGNTLSLNETRVILEEGITVKGKSMREHLETINHQEAIEYVESIVHPDYTLTEKDIYSIHALIMSKIEKDFAGRIRNAGVRIVGANFTPPNAQKVYDLLVELINWTNIENSNINPIIRAAVFHHRFVWIHPFFDGNGRSVRLLFNLLLMKESYPPAIILKNDRKKYYDALNRGNNGDYNKLFLIIIQALERSLDIYLSNLEDNATDYKPISNIVTEPSVPYGQEYVSLLARKGKINAYKEGNVWYTTEDAVAEYVRKKKK